MKELHWKTETRKVVDLIPADYNPRKISDRQKEELATSLERFGLAMPVVINTNNSVIGGHQRLTIFADLGRDTISVSVPDRKLTHDEEVELNLRLNQNGGEFDTDKLNQFDVGTLLEAGFDDAQLSDLFDNVETLEDEFNEKKAVAEAEKQTKVKTGDVYALGEHRLMVGDSTELADVELLMDGAMADMVYCDPPYNIGLDYSKGAANGPKHKEKKTFIEGPSPVKDSKTTKDYLIFLGTTLVNALAHTKQDCHVFYWCDEKWIWILQTIYNEIGIANKRVCIWIKNNFSLTPQAAFNKATESCVYGTRGKPGLNKNYKNLNEVLNREVGAGNQVHDDIMDLLNIWLTKRDNAAEYDHPTQKPVTLHEKAIKRCSMPGDIVLDLFGGSGSTLISCEQLKRRAYLMEQSPIFAQVIISRYEKFTGNKAKKIS